MGILEDPNLQRVREIKNQIDETDGIRELYDLGLEIQANRNLRQGQAEYFQVYIGGRISDLLK